jgi:hypothetical protein
MGTNGDLRIHTVNLLGRKIVGGPSDVRLFDVLRLGNKLKDVSLTFEVEGANGNPMTLKAGLLAIRQEDGSGQSWFLTLVFAEVAGQLRYTPNNGRYDVYYNSHSRTGTI